MFKLLAVFFSYLISNSVLSAEVPSFELLKEIPIGGTGGWDDLTLDAKAQRLYMTQSNRVVVIDLEKSKVVGEISGLDGAHGFALVPELDRGFATGGKEDKVTMVDLVTLKVLQKIPTGKKPDAIVYDELKKEIYAFNGDGHSATIIDARTGKVVKTLPLPGAPEFAVVDPSSHRIYVNLEDKNQVAAIDVRSQSVTAVWSILPVEEPSGIALDLKHHRVFSTGRNGKISMLDVQTGKLLDTAPIGSRPDGAAFDPSLDLAMSSNGEGTVTILRAGSEPKLSVIQTLTTEKGARTMTLDPKNHRLYLPSAKFDSTELKAGERPRIVPGSIKLLVFGLKSK